MHKYLKYNPLLLTKSGSSAAYNVVCAPNFVFFTNGQNTDLTKYLHRVKKHIIIKIIKKNIFKNQFYLVQKLLNTHMCRIISVSTTPGCNEFTVTPVPFKRSDNSLANNTFANLL